MSNDLLKPLGVDRPEPKAWRVKVPLARILGGVLLGAAGALSLYVTFANDPLGGEPHALVSIEGAVPGGQPSVQGSVQGSVQASLQAKLDASGKAGGQPRQERGAEPPSAEPRTRASASDIEAQSGVSVVRPDGAEAAPSVIIQIPDAFTGRLKPAPDQRLTERSRYGLLPKIGADGSRPAKVYARPPDAFPGGARPTARVALVVGGLGISPTTTADAVAKLPTSVTLAFAPHGGDLDRQVAEARAGGHEVMLQAPMEPFDYPDNDPGPHTLTVRAKAQENIGHLHWAMGRFTGYVGVVNFMGAKLTADQGALAPILREIGSRGLVFLDDGSSSRSLVGPPGTRGASAEAPTARADMVLDGVPRPDAIDRQLERLEQLARQRGFAIASASALPVTVERIAQWARTLEARGVLLVPVSSAFEPGAAR